MRKPIYIRPLTPDEQQTLQEGLRSSNAFVLRRCQLLLASARGQTARVIAETLCCDDQTVRGSAMFLMPPTPPAWSACAAGPLRRSGLRMPLSMPRAASSYAPYCTRVRAPLATPPASGRWRWQPRRRIPRASRTGPSVAKAFAAPWYAWVYAGSGPNTGSPAPILPTFEKKTARPADSPRRDPANLGLGLGG